MQPQQPYYPPAPAPAPPQPNMGQYDFITGGSYQQPVGYRGGNSKKMIIFAVVGAVVVIAIVWMILSLLFGGKGENLKPLVGVAQQQTEIVRLTDAALQSDTLSSQDVMNFAQNTNLTLSTDKATLVGFLAKNGTKVDDKELSATKSSQSDSVLAAAKANGTYDSTFVQLLQDKLKAYESSLQQAYGGTPNTIIRGVVSSDYDNAKLLLQQSDQRS